MHFSPVVFAVCSVAFSIGVFGGFFLHATVRVPRWLVESLTV